MVTVTGPRAGTSGATRVAGRSYLTPDQVFQRRLRSLTSQLITAEERERHRIASELHDCASQNLSICHMRLGALTKNMPDLETGSELKDIACLLRQVIGEIHSLTFDLSCPLLYEGGLGVALRHVAAEMQVLHGMASRFEDDGEAAGLSIDVQVLLFRAVRELLMNVVKHARARRVSISIARRRSEVVAAVEDDGVGFLVAGIRGKHASGLGLANIGERLACIGGHMRIDSSPGKGTRVTMAVPLGGELGAGLPAPRSTAAISTKPA